MIAMKAEVNYVLINILQSLFKKGPSDVSVSIDRIDALLMVRLCVNNHRTAWMKCVIESDEVILIGDIEHSNENTDYNKGYGSLMMGNLLRYARENGFKSLYGNLSVVDLDHKDRLHHFYEKFGFTITEYQEPQGCYYGEIGIRL